MNYNVDDGRTRSLEFFIIIIIERQNYRIPWSIARIVRTTKILIVNHSNV